MKWGKCKINEQQKAIYFIKDSSRCEVQIQNLSNFITRNQMQNELDNLAIQKLIEAEFKNKEHENKQHEEDAEDRKAEE